MKRLNEQDILFFFGFLPIMIILLCFVIIEEIK